MLEVAESFDELDGLGLLFEDFFSTKPAGDDEDVVLFEVFMSGLVIDISLDGKAGGGGDAEGSCCNGALEGFACWERISAHKSE